MQNLLRTFFDEPRAPGASGPRTSDWVLVAVLGSIAIAEGLMRETIQWHAFSVALILALILTLPWRRQHPFAMTVIAFGATGIVHAAALVNGTSWMGLNSNMFLLILPFALLRWGTGREALFGLGVITLSFAGAMAQEEHGWGEILGASLFLLFPAALGAMFRYQDAAQRRVREQVRLRERERLARELHDTVAHYVSAIAVQAQAGRALAESRPEASFEALANIEEAASRTLNEMREMVSALRDDDTLLAPAPGLVALESLASQNNSGPSVSVTLEGSLEGLGASVQTALYRLAQEAITNARRHARDATRVRVRVVGEPNQVCLTVDDDGAPTRFEITSGYGLRGMSERAALLGGSVHAGPRDGRGWQVEAVLPRRAGAS
ncbi:MAG: histidine kinase [Pseudomonadales bacterium]|nr:histidine kinase [Pseudomonadales bacterium]